VGAAQVPAVLREQLRARQLVLERAVRVAGLAHVDVVDAGAAQRGAERRLREAATARQRQIADIDHALDAM